jgi:hypothetical protein
MDVTTSAFSFTQVILTWTLLGVLLTWLITFAILALRSFFTKKAEWEDTLTLSGAFPASTGQQKRRYPMPFQSGLERHRVEKGPSAQ